MKRNERALAVSLDLSARWEELSPLLERQARLYTMGDSTSLPAETAKDLLRSIQFCAETHLTLSEANPAAPLAGLFEAGQRDVWLLTEEARVLHRQVAKADPGYGSIACRDTVEAVEGFFRAYDLRFFAHQIPCIIDYPLALPVPEELEGVRFIGEYLRRLLLEHRLCGCFARQDALALFAAFHPEYRELVLNLFEPLLTAALGLALLARDPAGLRLTAADCERLYGLFRPWNEAAATARLREAASRLCIRFRLWDTALRGYLLEAAASLLPLLRTTSYEGYPTLFMAR